MDAARARAASTSTLRPQATLNVLFGSLIALLAVTAAVLYHRRQARSAFMIDDEQIRAIEERGSIELDEPLDMESIREEERRFFEEEEWDEAEEW